MKKYPAAVLKFNTQVTLAYNIIICINFHLSHFPVKYICFDYVTMTDEYIP